MTRLSITLAGLVAIPVFACNAPPRARAPVKEERFVLADDAPDGGDGASGPTEKNRVVIQDPDSGNRFHGYWHVSDEQAERADEGVEAYLRTERPEIADKLGSYYGQIFGILDESGHKLIHFNFACKEGLDIMKPPASDPHPELSDWQHHVFVVYDGGDCYFQLDFDPARGEYENLVVNGEA